MLINVPAGFAGETGLNFRARLLKAADALRVLLAPADFVAGHYTAVLAG